MITNIFAAIAVLFGIAAIITLLFMGLYPKCNMFIGWVCVTVFVCSTISTGIAAPEAKKMVFLNNFKEGYYIVDADEAITQFDDKDVEDLALALKNKNINTCKIEKNVKDDEMLNFIIIEEGQDIIYYIDINSVSAMLKNEIIQYDKAS